MKEFYKKHFYAPFAMEYKQPAIQGILAGYVISCLILLFFIDIMALIALAWHDGLTRAHIILIILFFITHYRYEKI